MPETLKAEAFEPADGRSWSPKSAYLLRGLDLPGTLLRPANPGETGRKNPRQSDRESYTARMWFGPPGNRNFPDMCAGVIYFHPIKHLLVGFVAPHADFRMRMLDLKAATADFSDFTTLYPPYQALLDAKMANGGTAEEID